MRHSSMMFRQTADGVLVAPPVCGLLAVPDLIGQVRSWRAAGTTTALVVDLSEVEHVEGSAYRALVWARQYCAAAGRQMAIIAPEPGVLTEQEDLLLQMFNVWPGEQSRTQDDVAAPFATA